ncbi:hypothetical protein ABEB36_002475 [Hypothenemus hampei]|uniref:Uncharacterized protein n=1 Tax=Hypothenemus hampei TaxID=57062 RepID=A0ABD1F5V6_HYPHA
MKNLSFICSLFLKIIVIRNMSEIQEIKKRKRTKNTTVSQYEIYLDQMENNYAFRSNTINPTLPVDYIEKRWDDLVNKLNCTGDGKKK